MNIIPHKTAAKNALVSVTTFTGKEWCKSQWLAQRGPERGISETGYGYFGARYYDSDLSGSLRLNPQSEVLCGARLTSPQDLFILSVDPMADKYPNISPYAYCAWNPVKIVDPDGMAYGDPPASLKYKIKRGDCFWNLENEWNLPHGTLQEINPSLDPHNLQVGQVINAARLDNDFIVVGNDAPIPNGREMETPNEEGPLGLITLTSSEDYLQFRMAFEAILPSLGGEFIGFTQKAGRSLTKILSRNTSWQYGHNHSMIKWNNEFKKRGWSENQVSKTIKNGKTTPATNKVNPGNKATRYMNKNTGKSGVIDKKSRELLHIGSKDFKYD